MQITIPKKFQKCLAADPKWKRRTEVLTDALSDVLSRATDFFPEYTDHGVDHVNTVLELAAELIPGKSISSNTLSARDAACLVAAIAIHDLGMFLTPAGLNMLMTKDWDSHRNEKLDKYSWSEAWERYVSETKRLPQERMLHCFGRMIEVEKTTLVKEDMTWDDKLVIGEFLRRNHTRLAQEIAKAGLPGSTVQHFLEDAGFGTAESNIIGLIARSHGMSLRKVEVHLGTASRQSNVPVYYLMALLRLADLLDASEDRAPMIRIRQEDLGSPLSKEEWALNRCFHIDSSAWYPEIKNYTVTATPETSSEYARLEKWLEDAQRELDLCWAALAEKYPEGKLKLSIHRIKCTMHEPLNHEEISDRILPREVKVTANPEIVKLMIEPLYGDEPTYGVRELLQNAVDACVERKEWERRHGNPNYKGLVDVRVEGDTFTIADNGMGMNEDILLNYYLSAGSSYRSSEAWKAANAPDGESQVARTGKFGVGFLASFLLGDEIEVHTQHWDDRKGYWFKFDQRSMPLDVERKARSNPYAIEVNDTTNIGTTIRVKLKDTAIRDFNDKKPQKYPWYNWYAFDDPKVRYYINGIPRYHQKLHLSREPTENREWLTLPSKDFDVYQWKPHMIHLGHFEFYCNGIRVYDGLTHSPQSRSLVPHISVIDKRGKAKIDISRRTLQEIPDERTLFQDVYRWHIARLLLTSWDTEEDCLTNCTLCFPLIGLHRMDRVAFLLSPHGFNLNILSAVTALSVSEYVILYYKGTDFRSVIDAPHKFLKNNVPCIICSPNSPEKILNNCPGERNRMDNTPKRFLQSILGDNPSLFNSGATNYKIHSFIASIWCKENVYQNHQPLPLSIPTRYDDGLVVTSYRNRHSHMPIQHYKYPLLEFPLAIHVTSNYDKKSHEWPRETKTLLAQIIQDVLTPAPDYPDQDLWIPFDMEERKKKFPKAFEELKVYMDYIKKYPVI